MKSFVNIWHKTSVLSHKQRDVMKRMHKHLREIFIILRGKIYSRKYFRKFSFYKIFKIVFSKNEEI